jgi:hypothetical protein
MKHFAVFAALLIVTAVLIAACGPVGQSTQGPTTWIDEPLDGAKLPLGPTEIIAHASDSDGVSSFDFYIDNTLLVHANAVASAPVQVYSTGYSGSPGTAGYLASATVGWNPSTPGVYTIRAVATDTAGNLGSQATAVVTVGEVQASPVPSPALVPTEEIVAPGTPALPTATKTPVPPAPTSPAPTKTPGPPTPTPPLPTATPKPPTATPPPPRRPEIAYFEANPATINAGECSTIRWGVDYASAVYLDGEGVFDHDERQVCPATTTTYTLSASSGGGDAQDTATVTVIQPPTPTPIITAIVVDGIPPYVTDLNANPWNITAPGSNCSGTATTVSVYAEDPSGVAGVRAFWTLESQSGQVDMTPQGGGVYEAVLGPFSISAAPANLAITFEAWDTLNNSTGPVGPINVSVTYCIG